MWSTANCRNHGAMYAIFPRTARWTNIPYLVRIYVSVVFNSVGIAMAWTYTMCPCGLCFFFIYTVGYTAKWPMYQLYSCVDLLIQWLIPYFLKNVNGIYWIPENGGGRRPDRPIHTWKRTILNDLKLDNTYEYDELYTKAQDRDDWSSWVTLCASRHRRD